MKYVTIKLTEDQLGKLLQLCQDAIKDLRDFTDSEQEVAFISRLNHTLAKAKIS